MPKPDKIKDRAIRIIDYLMALVRLRTKIIRDLGAYQSVVWICEIPHEKGCFTQAWGSSEEIESEIWIEIQKHDEPVLENVPEECEKWVNKSILYNTDDIPELLSSINELVEITNADNNDGASAEPTVVNKVLSLDDYPEVVEVWEKYIEEKWFPWADLHRRWQSVQDVYAKLFSIYQEQQKLGEEYELVVGLGFLTWRTPSGHSVRRHLLTAKCSLAFEAKLGKFTVTPLADGAQLMVELDMLDIKEQPRKAEKVAYEGLTSAEDNPWNRSSVNPVLSGLANSLADRGQGEYHHNTLRPSNVSEQDKPIVNYAPALILRKRSVRGLEETLRKMRENIENDKEIPPEFVNLCEGHIDRDRPLGTGERLVESEMSESDLNQTVYFPKPSNEEQKKIIQKLQSSSGVLVQGPPGTGKSHTIANLICHLLATGQRVLVTAKTPRALRVLYKLLPQQIQPLCINLLGSSIEEQRSLEACVSEIVTKQDQWNENQALRQAKRLEKSIQELRSEKAKIEYRLRCIRESETAHQSIFEGAYQGTAAKIALRLRKESTSFGWFKDNISYDQAMPLSQDDLVKLWKKLSMLSPERDAELQQMLPDPDKDLPSWEILEDLANREHQAKSDFDAVKSLLNSYQGNVLEQVELSKVIAVRDTATELIASVQNIARRPLPWIKRAIRDMLADHDMPWKELLCISEETLKGLSELARSVSKKTLSVPGNLDSKKLLADVKKIKKHFDSGGTLGWGPLKPKVIRENQYIIENVKIDGQSCNSREVLQELIQYLLVQESIDYVWELWNGKTEKKNVALFLQLAELEEQLEALRIVVGLYDKLEIAKTTIAAVNGLGEPKWHKLNIVNQLCKICEAIIAKHDLAKVEAELIKHESKISAVASNPKSHSLAHKLVSIIKSRDTEAYSKVLYELTELRKSVELIKWAKNTQKKLSAVAPILAKELSENPGDEGWEIHISHAQDAWNWSRAHSWLRDFLNAEDIPSLERRSRQIEDKIRNNFAKLAATRAWIFCFDRMRESHRRHLMGWQQAIKKLGKGTGKHAPKYRRTAKEHLNKSREAVPAWIMPLHRVYETIEALPALFDVIIVDEASQCGPESLPLMYLAKKLLVVGDEQQISPEAVGVPVEAVHRLINEHLSQFEHRDSFDMVSSLFAHGKRRFNNRIVLREHFRCMPEIIRFSNDLSYPSTPLIPLRQYPPQRLEPLREVHVPSGYREGTGNRVINRPEAEKVVEAIVHCCVEAQYRDKTMGVIVLQGEAQAKLIESTLLNEIGAEEIERRRLICGNPYSFQGDERDVIFLSMVAAPNERIGAFAKVADQQRFNVAASRAKDQMWLFHTATLNDLSKSCLRYRLLEFFLNPTSQLTKALGEDAEQLQKQAYSANRQIERPPLPFDSWFEVDVALSIAARGYRVIPQYPVANKHIDLVIEGIKSQLAVECDGDEWHGPEQYEKDMERQRMLERCGWRFYRIRECNFNANPEKSLESLWKELEAMGIERVKATVSNNADNTTSTQQNLKVPKSNADETQVIIKSSDETHQSDENTAQQTFLELSEGSSYQPSNIREALGMKQRDLRSAIFQTLLSRTNYSCVEKALPTFVLKLLGVMSRGKPREQFSQKVQRALNSMKRQDMVKVYKTSKNIRVKLSLPLLQFGLKKKQKTTTEKKIGCKPTRQDSRRLQGGMRTREETYYKPILQVLSKMGGFGKVADVLDRVGEIMKPVLTDADYEPLVSMPDNPRWRNVAQWARQVMVYDGLLKNDSPRGIWEIGEKGKKYLAGETD